MTSSVFVNQQTIRMIPVLRCFLIVVGLMGVQSIAQAQQGWFDVDVAREIGIETCATCAPPNYDIETYRHNGAAFHSVLVAYFDTTASWVNGRIVDRITHKPISGAVIQLRFGDFQPKSCDVKMAATDDKGFFRLGWVGSAGPYKSANRQLTIQAENYKSVMTDQVKIGALMYLHIELLPQQKR
ncbi:hypothetical protein [Hymenobacter swuensis]|uniref:hypothetical protein n=1 Tax=Hymenobacter swuensis TaxID=1446467 RepID=UPI0012DF6057|nr:hypothetical protein [Hymenobacter swuensis]